MVDPIDGTSNFIHGFPFSAVSIGLAVNKEPVVGVVNNFNLNQMFAAKKGGGATLNGKPIKASNCSGKGLWSVDLHTQRCTLRYSPTQRCTLSYSPTQQCTLRGPTVLRKQLHSCLDEHLPTELCTAHCSLGQPFDVWTLSG